MPGALIERPKMTKTMYQALKRHIMKEREKKKQEQEQDAMIERRKKEAELRKKKEQEDSLTLEQTKEQISELEKKLETLKTDKHDLFSQLKKVLHQEDESRKRAQLKEQSELQIMQHNTVLSLPHTAMSGRPILYRPPQPMMPMAGMKRARSPSPPPSSVYQQYPESKMMATSMAVAANKQHHYQHSGQPEYKQTNYPQGQPGQAPYVSQSGHTYQQSTAAAYANNKSTGGKYNPTSQSAFTSYPNHFTQQKQLQEGFPGYSVQRVQQAGYANSPHQAAIPLQQQLEHANQKSGFNEEKYKMQQQAPPIRTVAPLPGQQAMMHQTIPLQQATQAKGSIVTGYSAQRQAPPPASQYQANVNQSNYPGQQGGGGRPPMSGRFY